MPMQAGVLCDGIFERGRRLQLRRLIVHEVAIHQLEQSLPKTSLRGVSEQQDFVAWMVLLSVVVT